MSNPAGSTNGITRLSVPTVLRRSRRQLTEEELDVLRRVAGALIPAGDNGEVGADQIGDFADLAHEALAVMDPAFEEIIAALSQVASFHGSDLFEALRAMDSNSPKRFHTISLMVTGIYLYAPEVEAVHNYPHPHRNKASGEEIVEEIESGLLEPVIARGPVFREI